MSVASRPVVAISITSPAASRADRLRSRTGSSLSTSRCAFPMSSTHLLDSVVRRRVLHARLAMDRHRIDDPRPATIGADQGVFALALLDVTAPFLRTAHP